METQTLVNLNTAEADELTHVPGVGPVLAERIVETRPFASFDDVRRVPGIGPSMLDKIAPYATVEEALLVETETPAVEVASEGLSFVDMTPLADESEPRVTEIPADLIPLPPLPVVPPWDEETASIIVAEAAAPEVTPPPLPEAAMPSPLEEAAPSPAETPPPLPESAPIPSAVPETPTESPAQKPTPPPQAAQPKQTSTASRPVTRAELAWVSFAVFVVTLVITLALSLGILAGINGGLSFASPGDVAQVSREVAALRGQASTLEQSLNSIQTRLNNLEALNERVKTLEAARGDIQREVEALTAQAKTLSTQVQDLNQETEALSTQMEKVEAQTGQFQKAMEGLRDLLNTIFPKP